ncbi:hypothetical protein [Enterobacter asburiae]|uniref:hypothetical protein n=1 Tax=Enterobacter asburiae TaxID=61645 RepID=UPI0021D2ED27|nr:hypothetical protein [Enterobacter asburiae]MCU6244128.1 hypothetical protein [Enterobacter asburiae]
MQTQGELLYIHFVGDKLHEAITKGNTKRIGTDSEKYIAVKEIQVGGLTSMSSSYAGAVAHGYPISIMLDTRSDDMYKTATSLKSAFEIMCDKRVRANEMWVRYGKKASVDESVSDEVSDDYFDVVFVGMQPYGRDNVQLTLMANAKKNGTAAIKDGVVGEAENHVFDAGDSLGEPAAA